MLDYAKEQRPANRARMSRSERTDVQPPIYTTTGDRYVVTWCIAGILLPNDDVVKVIAYFSMTNLLQKRSFTLQTISRLRAAGGHE